MQRLLLDTHAFLWWVSEVARLTAGARAAIADPRNDVFVSAVSGWEIAVKKAKGKLTAPDNLAAMVDTKGFTHLPLTYHHAEQAAVLPMHHRDPLAWRPHCQRGRGAASYRDSFLSDEMQPDYPRRAERYLRRSGRALRLSPWPSGRSSLRPA